MEGPSTSLVELGIKLDTELMQMSLPERKLREIKILLSAWRGRKAAFKCEVQSLAGHLQDAAKVVRPGCCFVRLIYELTKAKRGPDQRLRLNQEIRSDIEWWYRFMDQWNGVSLFWKSRKEEPDVRVVSDASGSWGCGAFSGDKWLQHQWRADMLPYSIAFKELVPIVMTALLWGRQWERKIVSFTCDNQAVVVVFNKLYCRDLGLMHLLRCLIFVAAKFNFWFAALHIRGERNVLADAISRNQADLFLSQAPMGMRRAPTPIPQEIPQLLYRQRPDWLSDTWTTLFNNIMGRV